MSQPGDSVHKLGFIVRNISYGALPMCFVHPWKLMRLPLLLGQFDQSQGVKFIMGNVIYVFLLTIIVYFLASMLTMLQQSHCHHGEVLHGYTSIDTSNNARWFYVAVINSPSLTVGLSVCNSVLASGEDYNGDDRKHYIHIHWTQSSVFCPL